MPLAAPAASPPFPHNSPTSSAAERGRPARSRRQAARPLGRPSSALGLLVLGALLVSVAGCGGRSNGGRGRAPQGQRVPSFATVELVGVTMGPVKAHGAPWDGPGAGLTSQDASELAGALAIAVPELAFAQAMSVLARPAIQALDKPDVTGWAMLASAQGQGPPTPLAKNQDSVTPVWSGVRFARVPLDGSVRLRVALADADLTSDDPIGTFEIGPADLRAAVQRGRVHQVRVAEQTSRQVLFAAISVFPER